jgi:CPA2 family monovalent cation:H+ antiporter-2
MLGICFEFAIMANQIGFSVAIGAFLIGVVAAKSRAREEINKEIDPLQHVFGAIFFVSMGALMDITQIAVYWLPALVITVALIATKLVSCNFGTRLFGYGKKTALRVGLGLAQNRGVCLHCGEGWARRGRHQWLSSPSGWCCRNYYCLHNTLFDQVLV